MTDDVARTVASGLARLIRAPGPTPRSPEGYVEDRGRVWRPIVMGTVLVASATHVTGLHAQAPPRSNTPRRWGRTARPCLSGRRSRRTLRGCGAGHAVAQAVARLVTGSVEGLDPSPTMVPLATRYNRHLIAQQRVDIDQEEASRLPNPTASFDRIVSTHTVCFWATSGKWRVNCGACWPDVLLVLGFGDPERMRLTFPESVHTLRLPAEVEHVFAAAGFAATSIETREISGHAMFWLRAGPRVRS